MLVLGTNLSGFREKCESITNIREYKILKLALNITYSKKYFFQIDAYNNF